MTGLGHSVKLVVPQFVKPYVNSNKNDMADGEAICEAVVRPNMRFVPVKSGEHRGILALHRARQGFVKARTARANQIRWLLAEYGIVIPQGISDIARRLPGILEDGRMTYPVLFGPCSPGWTNIYGRSTGMARNWRHTFSERAGTMP